MTNGDGHVHERSQDIELLSAMLDITRNQLSRAMALSTELEALLLMERAKVQHLEELLASNKK